MNMHLDTPGRASPLLLGATLAVLLLSAVAIGSIMGVLPGGLPQRVHLEPVIPAAAPSVVTSRPAACANCGIVLAIRPFELRDAMPPVAAGDKAPAAATASEGPRNVYRVTVQMDDGSYRTLSQSATPTFSVGGKVRVIRGALIGDKS